jgi:aspartate aminotransferase
VVYIHACGHNPTGCDPSKEQRQELASIFKERELFTLFDAAYLGFNSGNVDSDASAIHSCIEEAKSEAGVCLSFAKNMGLYGIKLSIVLISSIE